MNEFLKDKLFLLQVIFNNYDNLDLSDDIRNQIKFVFIHFKDFLNTEKVDKREINKLTRYLEIINTYNVKDILIYGNKILSNAPSFHSR